MLRLLLQAPFVLNKTLKRSKTHWQCNVGFIAACVALCLMLESVEDMLTKPFRWGLVLRGGYYDRGLISILDHKPAVEPMSLLEKIASHFIYAPVFIGLILAALYFSGRVDIF